jgi:Tol biopolymer transport system component
MPFAPGDRFGTFEIIELMGAGGAGEVYRARDKRLQRDVALKVLAETRHLDPQHAQRFEREALLLASLNHPNIATLHGVEAAGDVRALVMELVDGETLADRLTRAREGLRLDEALRIAGQIAEALDAAHERGVVHRDLKPANIKVRSDGTVKVLDFGIAKSVMAAEHDDATMTATRAGTIIGTPSYMSPEQATGGPIDKRTDIWAFGCVLYEMLSGKNAFEGATVSDTFTFVISKEPDWEALKPNVPRGLRRLLQRCLQKDPRRRLRDAGDLRFALEDGIAETDHVRAASRDRFGFVWLVAGTTMLAVALALGWWFAGRDSTAVVATPANPLARAQFTRFTDFPGSERDAAISRDGNFVAFVSDRDGPFDVWLSPVGTQQFRNLTQGRELTGDVTVRALGIHYDGADIWIAGRTPDRRMRSIPLFGGAGRDFLPKDSINVAWSPDGAQLVYHRGDRGDPLFVADRTGANPRQIFVHPSPGGHNHFPTWSPDGRWIYFVSGHFATADMDLWRIAPSGGEPERLTNHHKDLTYPTLLDSRSLLYLSPADDGSGPWLWMLDTDSMITSRVTYGLEKFSSLDASADRSRLVATISNPAASLWSVPISDGLAEERDVKAYAVPTVRALAPRFGGVYVFYLSSLGSGDGLWRYGGDGQALEIWKGADGALLQPAAISSDGARVAIALRDRGRIRLNVMSSDGSGLRPAGETIDVRGSASWSPDNEWIVTGGQDAEGEGLFKVPVDGGAPVPLVRGQALEPVWSPDGSLIVYTGVTVALDAPLLAVRPDGTPLELPAIRVRRGGQRYRFLPNGDLVYMKGEERSQDFVLLNVATRTTRPLTQLRNTAEMRAFDITPDGTRIVFDRLLDNSDIVLIDFPREAPPARIGGSDSR